ncbi:MAG: integral rane protein MviN [Planctomycetaceae bacterium]|nr:integral rane protein MviN [Planctomycetaceae bacterium]
MNSPAVPTSADTNRPRSSLGAVSLLSGCLLTQFVMQFAYQLLLAKWYGAGIEMDAFSAAQAIPMVVATILVGSLQYAFVPVFIQRKEQLGSDAAWELAGTTGWILIPGIALLSLAGCLAAEPIIQALFPRFSEAQQALTIRQFQVLVWLTWTISVTAFFQTVLQAAQIYRPAAIGPLVGTAVTITASWCLSETWGIQGIAWATLGGALVGLAWQAPVFCLNARFRWRLDAGTRQMWLMLVPILLGAGIYKLDPLLDRYLASGLPEGSVSQLGYASRLITALLTLTSNGLAMVIFPVLSACAASGNRAGLKSELVHALQFLVFLLVPICLGLGWFAGPVVRDLFERGRFTSADTAVVSHLLLLYLGVLLGGSAGEILSKTFFALGDSRTPTVVRIVGFGVGAGLKLWWGLQFGLTGIVWATSCYYVLISGLDALLLYQRLGTVSFAGLAESFWKCGCGSVVALLVASLILSGNVPGLIVPAAIVAGLGYLVATHWLHDPIALRLSAGIRQRLWPK